LNTKEDINRRARRLLNKLTPDKYDIVEQLLKLPFLELPVLKDIALQAFEKACREPHFSSMYARIVRDLLQTTSFIPMCC
jgi:hypothetical protein